MATIANSSTASSHEERATASPAASGANAPVFPHAEESAFVRQGEFRLFKWIAAFTLASVVGGFGLLYQRMTDLEVGLERLRTDILREMHREHEKIRDEMQREHTSIRNEMHRELKSIRNEMQREHASIHNEMQREHKEIRDEMQREHESIRDEMKHQHAEQRNETTATLARVALLETQGHSAPDDER